MIGQRTGILHFFIHAFVGSVSFSIHFLNVYYLSITVSMKSEGEEIVIIDDMF